MGEEVFFALFESMRHNKMISGVILAALGLMFLISPLTSMVTVCRMVGWAAMIGGTLEIAGAVKGTPGFWLQNPYFYIGIFLAVLGIIVVRNPYIILDWTNLIFGVIVVVSSAMSLLHMQQMRKFTDTTNGFITILSIAGIVLGALIILNPFGTIKLLSIIIGAVLLYEAAVNFRIFSNTRPLNNDN